MGASCCLAKGQEEIAAALGAATALPVEPPLEPLVQSLDAPFMELVGRNRSKCDTCHDLFRS